MWDYLRHMGINKKISEIFEAIFDGWIILTLRHATYFLPALKKPCPFIDYKRKICLTHNAAQFICCTVFPEGALSGNMASRETKEDVRYLEVKGLKCIEGAKLSAERKQKIDKIESAIAGEIIFTARELHTEIPSWYLNLSETMLQKKRYFIESGIRERAMRVIRKLDDHQHLLELYYKIFTHLERYSLLSIGDLAIWPDKEPEHLKFKGRQAQIREIFSGVNKTPSQSASPIKNNSLCLGIARKELEEKGYISVQTYSHRDENRKKIWTLKISKSHGERKSDDRP
jgi:hypothetical protein